MRVNTNSLQEVLRPLTVNNAHTTTSLASVLILSKPSLRGFGISSSSKTTVCPFFLPFATTILRLESESNMGR